MEAAHQVYQKVSLEEKISVWEKIAYGLGDVGSNLVWATLGSFIAYFYTDVAGIGAGVVGTILLLSRILDGLSDLTMGVVVDKTKSKYGKARPWLLWVAIPYGIGAVLVFTVPNFSMTGKIIYAFLTYNLMTTVLYTIYNMPYGTLNSLITQDQYQRTILNSLRMAGGVVTALVVNNITIKLVESWGGGAHGWQMTALVYGVLAAVIILITFYGTRERVKPVSEEKIPLKIGLKALIENKYWKMVLVIGALIFILFGLPGVTIYYAQYLLGNPQYIGPIMTCNFIPNLVGFLAMTPLVKKIGKRNTTLLGFVVYAIGTFIIMMNPSSLSYVLVGTCIRGLGFAPAVGTIFACVADTIEYGEWKSGVRTEGLIYSAASFGQKFGYGLSLAMIGWVLALGGYIGGAASQPASALQAISFLFIHLPLVVYFLVAFVLLFYKLDGEYPRIVEELHRRKLQGQAGVE